MTWRRRAGMIGVFAPMLSACPPPDAAPPSTIATGTAPNAVAVARCVGGPRLVVAASGDAALDVIDATTGAKQVVFLGVGSLPWDVVTVDTDAGPRAVVALAQAHAVAVVDPCAVPPVEVSRITDDELIAVPDVTLRVAADVDGDGAPESVVTQMLPRSPQALVARPAPDGIEVAVAFANLLSFSTATDAPMLSGPGAVRRYVLDDDVLISGEREVLEGCDNPGGLAALDGGDLVIACAGRFVLSDDGHGKASDGAVVVIAADAPPLVGGGTPGPVVAIAGDRVVTGDLLDGAVRTRSADLALLSESPASSDAIDSAFALGALADGTLVAGWFDGRVQRDPAGEGPLLRPTDDGAPRGLVDVVELDGEVWALLTLSAELERLVVAE